MKKLVCNTCSQEITGRGSFCDNCGADITSLKSGRPADPMTGQYMTGQTVPGQPEQMGLNQRRAQPRKRSNSRFMFFIIFMGIYYLTSGFQNWNL
jgi:hypothetical protein